MNMVKVGEKGQIVIPKDMRELMGIQTGDTLLILADIKRGIAIPKKSEMEKITSRILSHKEEINE